MDDIHAAKASVHRTCKDLESRDMPFSKDFKIGVMVEILVIALIADQVETEVDFVSIGTNDLCQYLTASDRLNFEISQYYQGFYLASMSALRIPAIKKTIAHLDVKQAQQVSYEILSMLTVSEIEQKLKTFLTE